MTLSPVNATQAGSTEVDSGLIWMDDVFSSGEVKNSGGSEISYCSDEIGYCSSEISGGVCIWIQTQL